MQAIGMIKFADGSDLLRHSVASAFTLCFCVFLYFVTWFSFALFYVFYFIVL